MVKPYEYMYSVEGFLGETLWVRRSHIYDGQLVHGIREDGEVVDGAFYLRSWNTALSPDGSRNAFVPAGYDRIIVISPGDDNFNDYGRIYSIKETRYVVEITWSPNAKRIAFIEETNDKEVEGDEGSVLRSMKVVGGEAPVITRFPFRSAQWIDWSPDGRHLIVGRRSGAPDGPMWVVDMQTGEKTNIGSGAAPTWSPGGDRIAFAREGNIVTALPDGSVTEFYPIEPDGAYASLGTTAWQEPCTITGTDGPDVLIGTLGRDVICGREGLDAIVGLGGADVIYAGPGDDVIDGGPGRDILNGDQDEDLIEGGNGADVIADRFGVNIFEGGAGDDHIYSMDGDNDDVLRGGEGFDRCWEETKLHTDCERLGYAEVIPKP